MKAKVNSWDEFNHDGFIKVSLDKESFMLIIDKYKDQIDQLIYVNEYEDAKNLIEEYLELEEKLKRCKDNKE